MRLSLFTAITLVLVTLNIHCQNYQKAVVTDVMFVRQISTHIYDKTFPMYFNQIGFIIDVQSDIEKYLKGKFGVREVEFLTPDSINYFSSIAVPQLQLRKKARTLGGKDTLYVSVETTISNEAFLSFVYYKITTRVTVCTGKGAMLYKFTNSIPFETYRGEDISGTVQMGEQDFYAFYFDGLKNAFEGITKYSTYRYVPRPATGYYNAFLSKSEKFYMGFDGKSYVYGSNENKMLPVLTFSDFSPFNKGVDFSFGQVFESNLLESGFMFKNIIDNNKYCLKMQGGVSSYNAYLLSQKFDLTLDYIDSTDTCATFYCKLDKVIASNIASDSCILLINQEYKCYEIYSSDTLIALVNELSDKKVLFIHHRLNRDQLSNLLNMLLAHDYFMAMEETKMDYLNSFYSQY